MTIDQIRAWEIVHVPYLMLTVGPPVVAVLWIISRIVHRVSGRRAYARGRRAGFRNQGLDPADYGL